MKKLHSQRQTRNSLLIGLVTVQQQVNASVNLVAAYVHLVNLKSLMLISALLHSGDTAPSEDASEHDLLNSDSELSDEGELNPDDYSEDVSSPLLIKVIPSCCLLGSTSMPDQCLLHL